MIDHDWRAEAEQHKQRIAQEQAQILAAVRELGYDVRTPQEAERVARELVRRGQWAGGATSITRRAA